MERAVARLRRYDGSVRRSGAFDGVADFDAAVRDPANPARLRPEFEGTGHLHPNDAGYAAMGDSINLSLFNTKR